jgi:hypothetical protein
MVVATLKRFYGEIRKADGTLYANKSMIILRFGLQKHFLKNRQEDIINSELYSAANNMFIHSSIFDIYVCEVIPIVLLGLTLKFEGYISSPLSINFELKILLMHISQIFLSTLTKVI